MCMYWEILWPGNFQLRALELIAWPHKSIQEYNTFGNCKSGKSTAKHFSIAYPFIKCDGNINEEVPGPLKLTVRP